jgi:hypothetical protein
VFLSGGALQSECPLGIKNSVSKSEIVREISSVELSDIQLAPTRKAIASGSPYPHFFPR